MGHHLLSTPRPHMCLSQACTVAADVETRGDIGNVSNTPHTAIHHNTPQHTAMHCNKLQHTATQSRRGAKIEEDVEARGDTEKGGVATISRLRKWLGLFDKRVLFVYVSFAKETEELEPHNRCHSNIAAGIDVEIETETGTWTETRRQRPEETTNTLHVCIYKRITIYLPIY